MLKFIKGIAVSTATGLLTILKGTLIRSLKIEAVKLYVRIIGTARELSMYYLTCVAMLLLALLAFVMIHVGVLILIPCSIEVKAWIVIILGIIYGLISYTVISNMCSEKHWLEMTNATNMIDEIVKNEGERKD